VLAVWGYTETGTRVLLHLMAGSKEDAETVSAFFQDMRARGLGDPLLVISDGAPVRHRARTDGATMAHQQGDRDLLAALGPPTLPRATLMRNLAAKAPKDLWPEAKARVQAWRQAPSRAIARDLAKGVVADCARELPSAIACFEDDFEACIVERRAIGTPFPG